MKKISISIGEYQRKYGEEGALKIAKEIGADAVDFSLLDFYDYRTPGNIYTKSDEEIFDHFARLKKYAGSIGLEIGQTHGQIRGFTLDEEQNAALVRNAEKECIATLALGAPVCVMHTVTTIYMGPDADPELMRKMNFDQFCAVLPFAAKNGIKIATETFGHATGRGCIDFFGDLTEFINGYKKIKTESGYGEYFTTCIDTGHSNKSTRFPGNPKPGDVIRAVGGENISVLHLNDNDTLTDQHKVPLSGVIDWDDVLNALDEVGYNGNYNMELNLRYFGEEISKEYGAFSIAVLRNMLERHYSGKHCK